MAARQPQTERRPTAPGDIVMYEGFQWTVLSRSEEPGLEGRGPAATLHLEREEKKAAPTPYGQRQKYKTVKLHVRVAEGRTRLLASQASMFDE